MFPLALSPAVPRSPPWKKWLRLMTKGGAIMALKKAAIIPHTGSKPILTKGFHLSKEELMGITHCFQSNEPPETIRVNGCTYCLKSACPEQVVAFNGGRYLILSRTNHVTVLAVCESKDKLTAASTWLLRIASSID